MKRLLALITVLSLWLGAADSSQASFLNYFPALRAEVTQRVAALSAISPPTSAQKAQLKALGTVLKAIDKPSTSLASDLKNLTSVGSAIGASFSSDVILSNLLHTCVINYIGADHDLLTPLVTDLNALPAGPLKDAANTARVAAQNILDQAAAGTPVNGASSLSGFPKALSAVQKAIAKAQKKAGSGGGGGGGGGTGGLSATITIGGTNDNWVADISGGSVPPGALWGQGFGTLDISGTRMIPAGAGLNVAICSGFNGQPGTYALSNTCGSFTVFATFTSYFFTSGTLTITTFNAATHSLSGTFSGTASDGTITITISNGQFNLTNLAVTP